MIKLHEEASGEIHDRKRERERKREIEEREER